MSQQNGNVHTKPRRPRQSKNGVRTPEEVRAYLEYIKQLRDWLDALNDEEHDRAFSRKLTGAEQERITAQITYENYQKGGPLRELLEGTCFEGTL